MPQVPDLMQAFPKESGKLPGIRALSNTVSIRVNNLWHAKLHLTKIPDF